MNVEVWSTLLVRVRQIIFTSCLALIATTSLFLANDVVAPQAANAYPFWAQENYASPREATGRIVCANCHLGAKPTEVEVPQSVLPDTVFKAVVNIPYDHSIEQVQGDGTLGPLNVGAVIILPEGFTLAPDDRISEDMEEEVTPTYFFETYSEEQPNILIAGPLPGDEYGELVVPVLSPDPAKGDAYFGKYQIHVGGNRGRGQVYPTGDPSNNAVVTASKTGTVEAIEEDEDGNYLISIKTEDGDVVTDFIVAGPKIIVSEGDTVTAGTPITNDPNVGGFGQVDAEIVLQSPNRIKGLVVFISAIMLSQIFLVLKKKQIEKVQAAEMEF
ncbi:MAG: apocytochrome f [Leptolyngbyaceae bacterium]|nr:apocytochrome f [Leptolyngbyaceae bacterium]